MFGLTPESDDPAETHRRTPAERPRLRATRQIDRLSTVEAMVIAVAASAQGPVAHTSDAEAQQRFLAYAAHELRTPLATQRALLEVALANPHTDVATWREIGEDVLRACWQQERLLESCLTLARSRRGLQRCEPVDLAASAADALRAHDLGELERVVVLTPAWTSGDPDLLERLAANLVSNAIRHNIVGGRIEVATRTEAGNALLSISNTGPLIPARDLARLFHPFQRLNSSPRSSSDGVGLGLTIVQAIADAHDATVTAKTRTGGGLGIDVAFPTLD
jgi:signal transduction histidine kinase